MSYKARLTTSSAFSPAELAAGFPAANFAIAGEFELLGDTDTIAQILIQPDDYVAGSTTEPYLTLDLGSGGSGTTIIPTVTQGGGAPNEDIGYQIREHAGGTVAGNDFTIVRAVHLRAFALNPDSAHKCKVLATSGNFGGSSFDRIAVPLGYDSTAADRTAASEALLILPVGHTFASAHPPVSYTL